MANSILLGKTNVELKRKKIERLLQELQDQQALHNQHDVATIKELIKDEEPVQDQTAIYIGLILLAIIGCGVYCRYSSKPTIPDVQPKENVKPVKSGELVKSGEPVKSGIIDME